MRPLLVIAAIVALTGCSASRPPIPAQPPAPTDAGSLKQVGEALDARSGKVAAAVRTAVDNKDKPAVVEAEGRLALSFLPAPSEGELAIAKARAAKADQKDYAAAEAAGKKAVATLDAALAKAKAEQAEALRVSQLKDQRIADLTAEVERIKQEASQDIWTLTGAGLFAVGALTSVFLGPRLGIPLLLCGAFCGSVPFIIDSEYFEYVAGATLLICCGLGLWWLGDKVRDSVNAKPSCDEQAPKE